MRARAANWNTVELYVAPAGGGRPSDTLKEDLRLYFEDKRMLTTILEIEEPVYVGVLIEGDLFVKSQYLREFVRERVEDAVKSLLAFENVDFAQVYTSARFTKLLKRLMVSKALPSPDSNGSHLPRRDWIQSLSGVCCALIGTRYHLCPKFISQV
ncbi:MAG: hypothetical protein A4E55_00145 [Pelotomaculum sp. PtaU1.Bin035]|nr:MAG: hypothetical protein A4E55_00145 [Pelotomaculum sp. PtaU1.Bin035]